MDIRDSIKALEQEIYVACSEGDHDAVDMLEHQLEYLRDRADHPFDNDIYSLEGKPFLESEEW